MRAFFFLLALANVAFFAYAYFTGTPGERDPGAAGRQIDPQKIRLLTPEQAASAARTASRACFELGVIPAADAARATAALAAIADGARIVERRLDEPAGWWVYVPPLGSRQAANQRLAELRKQGIDDVSLLPEDSRFADAVSLGVFSSEEAAGKRLEALRKRGVRQAVVAPREGAAARVYLQVRDARADLRPRLAEVAGDFPGSEVRECPR
ncbi:MAG: SPOR domain-containing protein [Burkholderiales bacterium]|nr:SPOR domain-containing protein [Burkholderiales bacterium]